MKILVIHATAGAGHMKAAEAVYDGIRADPSHDAVMVDALDYTNAFFRASYRKTYSFVVSHLAWLWGFAFWLMDRRFVQPAVRLLRRAVNGLNARRLAAYLEAEHFDAVIATHFLANERAGRLKAGKKISSRLVCVVTDYDVHRIWLAPSVDCYAVATPFTKDKLVSMGVNPARISVTGIPVNGKFLEPLDRLSLCAKLGLEDRFTALVATGSFGFPSIERVIGHIRDRQVIVICGHNRALFENLQKKNQKNVKIFGLVDNMHELMTVSDVMVTKPGGLSIAEALVKGLALIFFSPIPGQETNNIRVLQAQGVGKSRLTFKEMAEEIEKLAKDSSYRSRVKEKTRTLGRPDAAGRILRLVTSS